MGRSNTNKSNDDDQLETPRRRAKRQANNGIWQHALVAILVAAVGTLCTTGLLWWQLVESANEDHRQQQIELLSRSYAGYFNGQITELKTRLNALANAKETVDALISNDPALIDSIGKQLTDQHGYARRIEIIPKGKAEIDNTGVVPISFAALDLILRAETEPFVGPEISRTQEQLVFVAQPILHDGVVRGVLFAAFDKKGLFFDPLTHMDAAQGRVRILQNVDATAGTEVFSFGTQSSQTSEIKVPLSVPQWTLVFDPNMDALGTVSSVQELLAGMAMIMGFFLAGISFAFSGLSRKLLSDSETLASYGSQLLRGRSPSLDRYKLPMFQQLASGFAQYSRGRKSPDAATGSSHTSTMAARRSSKEKPGAIDDNITDDLLSDDDNNFLQVDVANDAKENFGIEVNEDVGPIEMGLKLAPEIFRAYDIRGITTKNLTEDVVYWVGRAFAAESLSLEQGRVAVGRDGRHSSIDLRDSLIRGLNEGGVDVLDIGEVPTPLLYFATHAMDTGTGIMITGSHNPPDYNGLKMMIAGVTLAEDRIQDLRSRIEENRLSDGEGDVEEIDLNDHYVDRILEDVVVAQPCKVVVDCGNGVAGLIAPRLLKELGCEVIPLYCDVDGDFPNHHPDPADPKNLVDLIAVVKDEKADLGLAFDGDGDRLGVVTGSGEIIWPDKLLMLFAQDIVGRNPGADIIYDVKCSRHLNNLISEYGGRPIMWRTGHSHMKAKLKETGALLAGEFSGHICFGERWYGFDDALYSAARLLEIIGAENKSVDELFKQFPVTFSTPELKIETTESEKFKIVEALSERADFGDGTITSIDGVRVDFADGWGLIRASNTSPVLTLRFEADGQTALSRIKGLFQTQLSLIDPELKIP